MQKWLFRLRGVFFVAGLAAALTLSAFTSVGMVRGRQDYGCLTFNGYIFDLANGIALPHTYSPPSNLPQDDLSPNGRYRLVRHYDEQGALRLEPATAPPPRGPCAWRR